MPHDEGLMLHRAWPVKLDIKNNRQKIVFFNAFLCFLFITFETLGIYGNLLSTTMDILFFCCMQQFSWEGFDIVGGANVSEVHKI